MNLFLTSFIKWRFQQVNMLKKILLRTGLLCAAILAVFSVSNLAPAAGALKEENLPIYLPMVSRTEPAVWIGPDGGSVVCLAADPSDLSMIYAGTVSGGLYKSQDRGLTWSSSSYGLASLFIQSVSVDPHDGNVIYAGPYAQGIYKSTDAGKTWEPTNNGIAPRSIVYSIAIDPVDSRRIYAATRIQGTTYTGILYRSSDSGASWENVLEFSSDWVYSLSVSPSHPNLILAAAHESGPWGSIHFGEKGTWMPTSHPDFEHDYEVGRWKKGRSVAFNPGEPGEKVHYTAWYSGYVSYSENNASSWLMSEGQLGVIQIYPNGIAINPDNADIVYLAGHNYGVTSGAPVPGTVMRSSDQGITYRPSALAGRVVYSVAALGGSGDSVLAGTYNDGIYRSDNGGASWQRSMQGLNNTWVTGMVLLGGNGNTAENLYASSPTGAGVYRSVDGGLNWSEFNDGLNGSGVSVLVQHPEQADVMFALTPSAGLYRIDLSSSQSWAPVFRLAQTEPLGFQENTTYPENPAGEEELLAFGIEPLSIFTASADPSFAVLTLSFAPSDPSTAYLGTKGGGMFKSSDGGMNWSFAGLPEGVALDLAVSLHDPETVYAATDEPGRIYASHNSGWSWYHISLPDPNLLPSTVAIWPQEPDRLFLGTNNGVYRYDGSVWEQAGLSGVPLRSLSYHPEADNRLVAATDRGAFIYHSGLKDWLPLSKELDGKPVASINYDPADPSHLYLGSETQGGLRVYVWR
jgi:photosystem II stability/assembly factor-like uncharacterized protein